MAIDTATAQQQVLDAADRLFYERGVQAVGMDAIRAASGVSLKRLYQLFPSKDKLIEAYLAGRNRQWEQMLQEHLDAATEPRERILAVFDFLSAWFTQRDFRGCAFINSFGELGAISPRVAELAKQHKAGFRQALTDLAQTAGAADPDQLADHLILLSEGAITTSAISGSPKPAERAREAAVLLMRVSLPT
ncbi:TetR family transcriptional regulator [Kribbella sp. VKM Ac-2527]|uniref:TetR family transcriptional regulator n=1 Tax=Kribbella caucasensis TaxID=2512215 RepID=A0A4R6K7P3_9ACTN|nr:TetR/AcrR family transcriptional regulator [Kribbella sp. VKM Ac-2527]TDO44645.1 TetR family transcriptional regulator [Kribbella sp. VKM Ac-2527]